MVLKWLMINVVLVVFSTTNNAMWTSPNPSTMSQIYLQETLYDLMYKQHESIDAFWALDFTKAFPLSLSWFALYVT